MRHNAILHLHEPAHSSTKVLNTSHQIIIGSASGTCHFPNLYPDGWHSVEARLQAPYLFSECPPETTWGMVNSFGSVTIEAVLLSFDLPDTFTTADMVNLTTTINSWAYRLSDWLALLADGPTTYIWDNENTYWLDKEQENAVRSFQYNGGGLHEPERLSPWQWRHALDHASTCDELPAARNLLVRAERAALTERFREAVVDAATAVEIAITTGLRRRLAELATAPEVIDALLDRTKMLWPRIELAKKLKMELAERIKTDLVEVRNDAVHTGRPVSALQAQAAIRIARYMVNKYEPLNAHCDELIQVYGAEDYDCRLDG